MTTRMNRIVPGQLVRLSLICWMVLPGISLFAPQADSRLSVPDSSTVAASDPFAGHATHVMPSDMAPMSFSYLIPPLLSAQQACQQMPGWQWRSGGGFTMCFKAGNTICPAGYPWIRQTTARYTICVYMDRTDQMSENDTHR